MRIDYLNLRAFGHFTDYELLFDASKNFHLIYGPNEAGKSTTLRSITHFLYGFPQQTNDSFLHSNAKLRIEGQLQKANGDILQFIRRKGNKNTVLDLNGDAVNEELVTNFLNGISEQQFLNMFALDHIRLREGGESLLQSGGNLGESMFSAASGINILRKVFEELEKKAGDLYKKRATKSELNQVIKQIKELKKKINDHQLKIQAWKDLERTYNEGKKEIAEMIKQVKTLRSEQEKLQRIKLTLPKIAKQRELVQKLSELGDVPSLPENIKDIRQRAQQVLEISTKEKNRAEAEITALQEDLNRIVIPEGLIQQATIIDSLYREVQTYQNNEQLLPKLAGERKQLEERVLTLMKEIDATHANLANIDLFRLSAAKKETIRTLCKQKPLLDQTIERVESEQQEINEELQQKQAELQQLADLPNIDNLEIVIDTVKRAGQIETTYKTLIYDNEQKELQIAEELRNLPQWNGTYDELVNIPVPGLTETIKKFEQQRNTLLQKLQKVCDQIDNQQETIEIHEEAIRALESLAEIPSEEKLEIVRAFRQQGWQFILSKLQDGKWDERIEDYTKGQAIETVYEESVRDADGIADKMRVEAAKVGEKNKRLADIGICKKKIVELEQEKACINEEIAKWKTEWNKLWQPAGITPLTPEEMEEWLRKFVKIKEMSHEFNKAKAMIKDLEGKITQYKQSLLTALSQINPILEEKSLDELLTIAEKQLKKIQTDLFKRKSLQDSIAEIKRRVDHITVKKAEIVAKIRNWKSDWTESIKGTAISETAPVPVAERILTIYEQCAQAYDEFNKVERDQDTIKRQIDQFKDKVENMFNSLNIQLDQDSMDLAVNKLHATLQQAKQDEVAITNISSQLKKLQTAIKNANSEIENAETTLTNLLNQAHCDDLEQLEEVERTFALKKEYELSLKNIEEELLQLGNGLSLQAIMNETENIEHDSIGIELEEINRKLDEIEPLRSQLEQEHGVVKKEYEEKIQGNNTASVKSEQEKESLLAQLANLTNQYIQLKLASTLLQKGIEYYRNQNQDPILKRASELFAKLTLQSYAGLIVDYDEKDQPVLMGYRENGDKVPVTGMSDGATDQLYLSLRIASIEKYAEENEPIPLIVDDILVHFDDNRSTETLKVLLELSKKTQIIFFTHHARLVDIVKNYGEENDYQLTEIRSKEFIGV
ncbi:YhaN family protein [Bacillus sp. Marseille-P3661]|uniref:YhaN family protein n=1 Tax=Bacillus sp. Marseille-P3661 TaxID=1936234 RepID=UPI000C85C5DF|nr:YhaN family protein [Bacillus sp. Marseille-P3661]